MIFLSKNERHNLALMVYYALPAYYLSICKHFNIAGLPIESDICATILDMAESTGTSKPSVVGNLISINGIDKNDKSHNQVASALWTIISNPRKTDSVANDQTTTTVKQFERIAELIRSANNAGDDSFIEICRDAIKYDKTTNITMQKHNTILKNTLKHYAGIDQ